MTEKKDYSHSKISHTEERQIRKSYISSVLDALSFGKNFDPWFDHAFSSAKRNKRLFIRSSYSHDAEERHLARGVLESMASYGFFGRLKRKVRNLFLGR